MNGLLIINKEANYTSRDVVNIISKKLHTKKIGHTGTLDPIATGVLVLCVGDATKLVEIITSADKEYIAEVTLGILTDTLDITGNIIKEENVNFSKEQILNSLKEMTGNYEQEVPIYSAVKINGKKLYEYARNNQEITLPKRLVTIYSLELVSDIKYDNGKVIFKIKTKVSKGTYIRSLVNDIAKKLNTYGVMSSLERTRQGDFKIEESVKMDEVSDSIKLINPIDYLNKYKQVVVDDSTYNKIKNGSLLKNIYNCDEVVFKTDKNDILAIYKLYEKDKNYLKPWKMFLNK